MMPLPAHIIAPQYSVFDNGALHALLTLPLAVPLLALGLALGRLGWRMAAVGGALGLAGFAGATLCWPAAAMPLAAFMTPLAFLAAGCALLAGGTRYAAWIALIAAVGIGKHAGLLSRSEDAGSMFAFGTMVGGAEIVFFPALLMARYWRPWMLIPARIAASWLLAIGVMFLGLSLRPLPTGSTVVTETPAQLAACPGPHKHGVNGEFICLPIDPKEATPNLRKYDNKPPVLDLDAPKGGVP